MGIYFRPGITRHPEGVGLGYARFHWGIWIEPKGSRGKGTIYQVFYEPSYSNIACSGGWGFYKEIFEDKTIGLNMMGRIMVGKIPSDVTKEQVAALLSGIPLPKMDTEPIENCVSWTKDALAELQRRGWADQFDIESFMDHALERATSWLEAGLFPRTNVKENYTQRKFP